MFKITGTVKVVNSTIQVSEKFSKREFVLTDNSGPYEQHISFQTTQDKCVLLDNVSIGEQIEVSFNLKGREWTSPQGEVKYFNTIEAWRIEKSSQNQGIPQGGPSAMALDPITAPVAAANADGLSSDEEDDLPF
jgi:hypothetical protein